MPYGFSVRVNATETLPDELKYKDWGTSGSERIKLNLTPWCLMAGLSGSYNRSAHSIVRPDATPSQRLRPPPKSTSDEVPRWLHQSCFLCRVSNLLLSNLKQAIRFFLIINYSLLLTSAWYLFAKLTRGFGVLGFWGLCWHVPWVIYHKYSHPELSQENLLQLRFEMKLKFFAFRQKFI